METINIPIIEEITQPKMIEIHPSVSAVFAIGLGIVSTPDAICSE